MSRVYADGHAHLYPEYDRVRFFERGLAVARSVGSPLVLLLTESRGHDAFGELHRRSADGPVSVAGDGGPIVVRTEEASSLAVRDRSSDAPALFLVAGRQLVSRENLEVLVAGAAPDAGLDEAEATVEELVDRGLEAGAITIVPWGFGKWLGARGRRVLDLSRREGLSSHRRFFLGDTAARCWPWPTPAAFRGSARVLPGTDVLPLAGCEDGLASYGFRVEGELDPARPFASLVGIFENGAAIEPFGRRHSTWRALAQQLRYRLRG